MTDKQKVDIISYKRQRLSNVAISKKVQYEESSFRRFSVKFQENENDFNLDQVVAAKEKLHHDNEIIRISLRNRFKTATKNVTEVSFQEHILADGRSIAD